MRRLLWLDSGAGLLAGALAVAEWRARALLLTRPVRTSASTDGS